MYRDVSAKCMNKQLAFQEKIKTDSTFNFKNLKDSIGPITPANTRLYDLTHDPSESQDLYTSSERFTQLASEMYQVLEEEAGKMPDELVFFVGEGNRDSDNSWRPYDFSGEPLYNSQGERVDNVNKWEPWL